jgi:hypothetical protein
VVIWVLRAAARPLMRCCVLGGTALLSVAASAQAQSLADVARHVKPGAVVYVLERSGGTASGIVESISAAGVKLRYPVAQDIPADRIARIDRQGDPVWDGALKGAAIGVVPAILSSHMLCGTDVRGRTVCEGCPSNRSLCAGLEIGVVATIGALMDWTHVGRTTIYRNPQVTIRIAPILSRTGRGLVVRLTF